MSVRVVIGAQWGDEGKGKIVDILSEEAAWVVRYQGGANAGHTLKFNGRTFVLHLVPSGIFHPASKCVIGNGVVVDPVKLIEEINAVKAIGTDPAGRLFVSETAHVILSYHKILDQSRETQRGDEKIGTTGRGIGPAYIHKVARIGIRMMDLLDEELLRSKIITALDETNCVLKNHYHTAELEAEPLVQHMLTCASTLKPYICNTVNMLHEAYENGDSILLEGAQGSLLDVDHGTYPYVTSSSPTSGGACTGSGLPPTAITHVLGVTKAYCTRVGNGPFPTELHDETGETIRKTGHEFGATTGRPRRCGWLDLVALKYAARVNGINELGITKMDVLDAFSEIRVCTAYKLNGVETTVFPLSPGDQERAEPVYTTLKGWETVTRECKTLDELPEDARNYLIFMREYLNIPIRMVSTGPDRSETILL